jgi:hypothetical protein
MNMMRRPTGKRDQSRARQQAGGLAIDQNV